MTKLTISEARAEACTILLHVLLTDMPAMQRQSLWRDCIAEAREPSLRILEAEMAWLFRDLPEADSLAIDLDECD